MAHSNPTASTSLGCVFDGFKEHCSSSRISTHLAILQILREHHPDYHVASTETHDFDFRGFAAAGKAAITFTAEDEHCSDLFETVRTYTAPRRRLDGEPGSLSDSVLFGRFEFSYQGNNFILFHAIWTDNCFGQKTTYWYILAPKEGATISQGHHSVIDAMLLAVAKWTSEVHEEIYVFDDSYWTKSNDLWRSVRGASWDDVVMDPKMKQNLIDDVQGFFDNEHMYRKFGVPWKRGIILHGVPGNGKTISIKALMNYLSNLDEPIPSLYVKSLDNKCNMPQYSVNEIFRKARKMAPCLLVFEDLDSLIVDKVRSYFLNEVDGLESNDGILMIGSTNHLNRLDPAISKRPSRFDRKYYFCIPDRKMRIAYAEYWRKNLGNNLDIDFPADICPLVADLTEGFSFAYLKELFVIALLTVARGGKGIEDPSENGWDVVSETVTPAEPADAEAETVDGGKAEKDGEEKGKKKPRSVPVIGIAEHLKENVLLRVIRQQVKVLLHEMDNTGEEEKPLPLLSGDGSNVSSGMPACVTCG